MLSTRKVVLAEFHKVYHSEVGNILKHRLDNINQLNQKLEECTVHFRDYIKASKSLRKKDFLVEHHTFLDNLAELNNTFYSHPNVESYVKMNEEFIKARLNVIHKTAEYIDGVQDEKSFAGQPKDSFHVKFRKTLRRSGRGIQKLFRKKDNPPIWKRKIPLRRYAYLHFTAIPVDDLWNMVMDILKLETRGLKELKVEIVEIEELFIVPNPFPKKEIILQKLEDFLSDIIKYSQYFKDFRASITSRTEKVIENNIARFNADFYKLGTFELRARKIKEAKLEKKISNRRKSLTEEFTRWETTLFSYSEDWSFDLDLFRVKNSTLLTLIDFQKSDAVARERKIQKKLKVVSDRLMEIHQEVVKTKSGTKTFIAKLANHRIEMDELLNDGNMKIADESDDNPDIIKAIHKLKIDIEEIVNNISNTRMVPKSKVVDGELSMNNLVSVHPRELIQFEILPKVQSQFLDLENRIKDRIVSFEMSLIDIAHFVDYSLESAQTYFNQNDASIKEAKGISDESLLMGGEKVVKATNEVKTLYGEIIEEIKENLLIYENEVHALSENEKVSELRVRLLKAKAINKYVKLKEETVKFLIQLWEDALKKTSWILQRGSGVSEQLSKIYYQSGSDGSVTADISNFLAETRNAIEKLPFIYQRLFKLDPVSSGYLFFKRQNELLTIRNAYHNWRLNRFASLVLVGEKGAGVTSMVQHFLVDIPYPSQVIDLKNIEEPYKQDRFLSIFTEQLGLNSVNEIEELIGQIENFEEKRIVFVEGLQYLYLRKVDGFECLKLFFELTSRTNKNIFWVSSGTVHAWDYLDKVLRINEYFGYVVKLGEFSNEDMIEIVTKRHKVSGYDLQFMPSKVDLDNHKYTKLGASEKQEYLKKLFFQKLNVLAKGNISVALIFWLRSTGGIKDNVLMLRSMHDFDSSFIKDLEKEKLFSLHSILLHDGLTISDFCKVMRFKPEIGQMKLMQMFDDGLLLKFGERYVINFLLYRATINALKAQNLLH